MKTKKMSLAKIQGKLSRAEMKNINGGLTAPPPGCGGAACGGGGNGTCETKYVKEDKKAECVCSEKGGTC